MPYDTNGGVPGIINNFAGWTDTGERDPYRFIPYWDQLPPDIMLHKNGSVMAIIALDGFNFYLNDNATRNGSARRHFALLQILADRYTEIGEYLICDDNVAEFYGAPGGSAFWNEAKIRYEKRVLRNLKNYQWYITITVRPKFNSKNLINKAKNAFKPMECPGIDLDAIRRLEAKVRTVEAALRRQAPMRLGMASDGTSAMGAALVHILTTRRVSVPLGQPFGTMDRAIYRERVVHGPLGFLIERGGGRTLASVGRMLAMDVYPKESRVGMFDKLLYDHFELNGARWVLSNSIKPVSRAQSTDRLELTLARMEKSESRSKSDMEDLDDALDEISRGAEIRGHHSWSLAIHADDMESLDRYTSTIMDIVSGAGCKPASTGRANEAAYWSQLPGNQKFSPAPAVIGLHRFADFSGLDGYPKGAASVSRETLNWDYPILRFQTSGGTAYDHPLFDGRLGHTLFCGPSDSGKTSCLGMMQTAATALVGDNGTILTFDKDFSNKLTIENNDGLYTTLKRGEDSHAAPLRRLKNTIEDKNAIADLIQGMILSNDARPISERAKNQIRLAIEFVMRLPPEKREIGMIHAWLPPASLDPSEAANRLKPWCRGERMGWAFDGEALDTLDFDCRIVGVDITALINDSAVLPIMAAYLFYLASKIMDGRRLVFIVEELKFFLPKPEFTLTFEDIILTGRKKNVSFWAAIQQPESIISHSLGPALLSQMRTRFLFKNEFANRDAYCNGLQVTPQEFYQVQEGMTAGTWSVLIQRPGKSVLCRFDLSSTPEDLAIYSATPRSAALWDKISETRKEFLNRIEEAKA